MHEEIAAYFRETARGRYEVETEPPFTIFFHPTDPLPYFNYAIPDDDAGGDLGPALSRLEERFRNRNRSARFEIVDGHVAGFGERLAAAGFDRDGEAILMTAPTAEVPRVATPEPFRIEELGRDSPLATIAEALRVARAAFGAEGMASDAEARWERERIGDGALLLGRIGAEPVTVATLLPIAAGWTEVAGVATLEPYRRRGLGAAVVAECLRIAARRGVPRAVLSAGSDAAGRVYETVGFRKIGTVSFWRKG